VDEDARAERWTRRAADLMVVRRRRRTSRSGASWWSETGARQGTTWIQFGAAYLVQDPRMPSQRLGSQTYRFSPILGQNATHLPYRFSDPGSWDFRLDPPLVVVAYRNLEGVGQIWMKS
jgi:hypothetical protein